MKSFKLLLSLILSQSAFAMDLPCLNSEMFHSNSYETTTLTQSFLTSLFVLGYAPSSTREPSAVFTFKADQSIMNIAPSPTITLNKQQKESDEIKSTVGLLDNHKQLTQEEQWQSDLYNFARETFYHKRKVIKPSKKQGELEGQDAIEKYERFIKTLFTHDISETFAFEKARAEEQARKHEMEEFIQQLKLQREAEKKEREEKAEREEAEKARIAKPQADKIENDRMQRCEPEIRAICALCKDPNREVRIRFQLKINPKIDADLSQDDVWAKMYRAFHNKEKNSIYYPCNDQDCRPCADTRAPRMFVKPKSAKLKPSASQTQNAAIAKPKRLKAKEPHNRVTHGALMQASRLKHALKKRDLDQSQTDYIKLKLKRLCTKPAQLANLSDWSSRLYLADLGFTDLSKSVAQKPSIQSSADNTELNLFESQQRTYLARLKYEREILKLCHERKIAVEKAIATVKHPRVDENTEFIPESHAFIIADESRVTIEANNNSAMCKIKQEAANITRSFAKIQVVRFDEKRVLVANGNIKAFIKNDGKETGVIFENGKAFLFKNFKQNPQNSR